LFVVNLKSLKSNVKICPPILSRRPYSICDRGFKGAVLDPQITALLVLFKEDGVALGSMTYQSDLESGFTVKGDNHCLSRLLIGLVPQIDWNPIL
jgi:hypothetical protein